MSIFTRKHHAHAGRLSPLRSGFSLPAYATVPVRMQKSLMLQAQTITPRQFLFIIGMTLPLGILLH